MKRWGENQLIVYNKTSLAIIAVVGIFAILTSSAAMASMIQPVHALTRFFNCTTSLANSTHHLTVQDVNACYNKEFHSTGGPGVGTITTTTGSGEHKASTQQQQQNNRHHDITNITPTT
jgi:hypothetical protein